MFSKLVSSALLFLVLAQGALATPKPIVCGGPNEPTCPPPCDPACTVDKFCCGRPTGSHCVALGGFCPKIG
ncbi:hypothetical protein MVEN_00135000 [Mycena venus]|uniref:Granulins domain-containing protein n=1 Tax=Mycena venus TaxID=2733690 RepID=A0A8H6YW28_9AGAR|nr:hypothetical protein MVEN_00135000 [Mycena venus]